MKYIVKMNDEFISTFSIDTNGESVIKTKYFNESKNLYFNKTATFVMTEIEKKSMSIDDIVDKVMKKYQMSNFNEILNDVVDILKQLWSCSIISFESKENLFEQIHKLQNGDIIKRCTHEDINQILKLLEKDELILYSNPYINKSNFLTSDSIHVNIINKTIKAYYYMDKYNISELIMFQEDSIINNMQILLMYTQNANIQISKNHFAEVYKYSLHDINAIDSKLVLEVAEYNEEIRELINLFELKLVGTLKKDSLYGDVDVYQQK